jgi:hypothetical protein
MRTANILLLALFLAASAFAAPPELVLGREQIIPGQAWGGAAATNERGTLIASTTADAASVILLTDITRPVALPRWTPAGSWYESAPAVAASPATWLVAWSETTNTTVTYLAARVAADLTILDGRPIFLGATRRGVPADPASIAWNGTEWLVAIHTTLARISLQGVVLERTDLPGPSNVAASGSAALVASLQQKDYGHCGFWPQFCTFSTFYYLSGRTVDDRGAIRDTAHLTPEERFRSLLTVAGGDDGFVVASVSGGSPSSAVLTTMRVNTSGVTLPEQVIDVSNNDSIARAAIAGAGDGGFALAWTTRSTDGAHLRVSLLDELGRRTGETVTIGGTREAIGPLSLVRLASNRYVLLYPRDAGLVIRELQFGKNGRGRAVGH